MYTIHPYLNTGNESSGARPYYSQDLFNYYGTPNTRPVQLVVGAPENSLPPPSTRFGLHNLDSYSYCQPLRRAQSYANFSNLLTPACLHPVDAIRSPQRVYARDFGADGRRHVSVMKRPVTSEDCISLRNAVRDAYVIHALFFRWISQLQQYQGKRNEVGQNIIYRIERLSIETSNFSSIARSIQREHKKFAHYMTKHLNAIVSSGFPDLFFMSARHGDPTVVAISREIAAQVSKLGKCCSRLKVQLRSLMDILYEIHSKYQKRGDFCKRLYVVFSSLAAAIELSGIIMNFAQPMGAIPQTGMAIGAMLAKFQSKLSEKLSDGYRGEVILLAKTKTLLHEAIETLCLAQNTLSKFAPSSYLFQAHKEVNEGKIWNIVYSDDAERALRAWQKAEDLLRKDVTKSGWDRHEKGSKHMAQSDRSSNVYSVSSPF